jgi:hypothetical protein
MIPDNNFTMNKMEKRNLLKLTHIIRELMPLEQHQPVAVFATITDKNLKQLEERV